MMNAEIFAAVILGWIGLLFFVYNQSEKLKESRKQTKLLKKIEYLLECINSKTKGE